MTQPNAIDEEDYEYVAATHETIQRTSRGPLTPHLPIYIAMSRSRPTSRSSRTWPPAPLLASPSTAPVCSPCSRCVPSEPSSMGIELTDSPIVYPIDAVKVGERPLIRPHARPHRVTDWISSDPYANCELEPYRGLSWRHPEHLSNCFDRGHLQLVARHVQCHCWSRLVRLSVSPDLAATN